MHSQIKYLPATERASAISTFQAQLGEGKVNLLTPYKKRAEESSFDAMIDAIKNWAAVSLVGGVGVIAFTGSSPALVMAGAATVTVLKVRAALRGRKLDIKALRDGKFGYLLTDEDLIELDGFLKLSGEPSTPAIKQAHDTAKRIVAAELVEEDEESDSEAIEVEAVESDSVEAGSVASYEGVELARPAWASSAFDVLGESTAEEATAEEATAEEATAGEPTAGEPTAAGESAGESAGTRSADASAAYSPTGSSENPDHQSRALTSEERLIDDEQGRNMTNPRFSICGSTSDLLTPDGAPSPRLMSLPITERARILLDILRDCGCDLEYYMNRPAFAAGGMPRTAKSTLLILMSIFEKAMYGRKIFYVTADDDVYPVAFDGICTGSPAKAKKGFLHFARRVRDAGMGGLSDESWILDEFATTTATFEGAEKELLWSTALTGMQKRQGRGRYVLHGTTSTMCGVPTGWNETFKRSLIMSQGEKLELRDGTDQPTGKYQILRAEGGKDFEPTGKSISIPEWLKTEVNPQYLDAPCPIRTVLMFFPELDTREQGAAPAEIIEEKAAPTQPIKPAQNLEDEQEENIAGEEFSAEEVTVSPAELASLPSIPAPPQKAIPEAEDEPLIPGTSKTQTQVILKVAELAKAAPGAALKIRGRDGFGQAFSGRDRPGLKNQKSFEKAMTFLATKYPKRYQFSWSDSGEAQLAFIGQKVLAEVE